MSEPASGVTETVAVSEAATAAAAVKRVKVRTLVVMCSALFLALLDSTVITLALPTIGNDFGVGLTGLQWIIGGYILTYASLLLAGGALGDRYGRHRVFIAGMGVFVAGSLLCALSDTTTQLIAGRAVQGIGAAAITPQTLAILAQTFPEPAERARAFGVWSGVSGLALVLGPLLGGNLVQVFGWQSVFLLNIPVCAVAMALASRLPAESGDASRRPVSPRSLLLTVSWLGCLTYALVEGNTIGWASSLVAGLLSVAAVSFATQLLTELRSRRPTLQLTLFRSHAFTGAASVTFLVAFGLNAVFLLLSLLLQRSAGLDPAAAGNRLLPTMGAIVVAAFLGGRVAGRFGSRIPVTCGTGLAGASLLVLSTLVLGHGYSEWWPLFVTFGFGVGMVMSPNNAALMASAPAESAGQASALNAVGQQVGALLGIAALGSLVGANSTTGASTGPMASDALAQGIQVGLLAAGVCYLLAAAVAVTLLRPAVPSPDRARVVT